MDKHNSTAFPNWTVIDSTPFDLITMCCILPIVCAVGLVLNCFCIFMFASLKSSRGQLQTYLLALCVFDLLQLCLSVIFFPLHGYESYRRKIGRNGTGAYVALTYLMPVIVPLLYIASYSAVWTMTLVTYHRFRAICGKLRTVPRISKATAHTQILVVVALATLANIPACMKYKWKIGNGTNEVMLEPTKVSRTPEFGISVRISYLLIHFIMPALILLSLNLKMIHTIASSRKDRKLTRNIQDRSYKSIVMMGTIIVTFFLLHTLGLYITVSLLIDPGALFKLPSIWLINDLHNLSININSAINPIIYIFFTKKFRTIFRELTNAPVRTRAQSFMGAKRLQGLLLNRLSDALRETAAESESSLPKAIVDYYSCEVIVADNRKRSGVAFV